MSIRDLLWLQVLFHRFIHTYKERSTRMNWCTSFLPYCAVSLRSAAIRSASAFIFARCSSEPGAFLFIDICFHGCTCTHFHKDHRDACNLP